MTPEEQIKQVAEINGKCFRFIFSEEHVELIKILTIAEYKDSDALMNCDIVTNYKGQISFKEKQDTYYSNWFPEEAFEEISDSVFSDVKSKIAALKEEIFLSTKEGL